MGLFYCPFCHQQFSEFKDKLDHIEKDCKSKPEGVKYKTVKDYGMVK